jgi:hypothetical protein
MEITTKGARAAQVRDNYLVDPVIALYTRETQLLKDVLSRVKMLQLDIESLNYKVELLSGR